MPDVAFKTNEYNKEMRRMKRTIIICVAVFVILICFSAYVIRIKDTSNGIDVVHFNQDVYKGKPHNHQPQNDVLEPGRFGGNRKGPQVHDDGRGGDRGRGDGDRARGHGGMRRLPQTTKMSYNSGQRKISNLFSKQQFLKNKMLNNILKENKVNNTITSDNDTKSSTFLHLGNKLKELAKKSGLDVSKLLERLWNLKGKGDSQNTRRVTPPSRHNQYDDRDRNPSDRFEDDNDRYWYDRHGMKHRDYKNPNSGAYRDGKHRGYGHDYREQDNERFRGEYRNEDDSRGTEWQRGRMEHNRYYNRNRGSNRDEWLSNRRYNQRPNRYKPAGESGDNTGMPGNKSGRIYNNNKNQEGYDKDNRRNQGENVHGNFSVRGGENSGQRNSEERRQFDDDYGDVTNKSGRHMFPSHNDSNSAMDDKKDGRSQTSNNNIGRNNGQKLVAGFNTKMGQYNISNRNDEIKPDTLSRKDPLYSTRNLIKQRINSLIQQQKAQPEDKSLFLSIALLQSTLDSIETELGKDKARDNKTAVTDEADNKTVLSQLAVGEIKRKDSQNATSSTNSFELDDDSYPKPQAGKSATVQDHKIKNDFKEYVAKAYVSTNDINALDINIEEDWQGSNNIIIHILSQLMKNPTKVDMEDLTKRVAGMFSCVPLKSVNPHPLICINNPKLDKPLSRSLKSTGLWERDEVIMFKNVLKSNPSFNVIDLGSSLGVYTITAATLGRSVVAVEPLLMNIVPFHRSVRFNRFPPTLVKLVTNPITDYHGVAEMIYRPYGNLADARTSPLTLKELHNFKGNVHNLVRTITLDDLSAVIPFKTAVLKIDIQGDEYAAFKVANKFFDKIDIRYIFMHWIPTENQTGSEEIADFLVKRNYKPKASLDSHYLVSSDLKKDQDVIIWIKQYWL